MHFLRFSKTEDAQLLELYAAGKSYLQIGRRLGRHASIVYHRLVRLGVVCPQRRKRRSADEVALIDSLGARGFTGYRIAKITGLPSATVYWRLRGKTPTAAGRASAFNGACDSNADPRSRS